MTASQCMEHPWVKGTTDILKEPSPVTEAENMLDDIEIKSDKEDGYELMRGASDIVLEKADNAFDSENEIDSEVSHSLDNCLSTSKLDKGSVHLEDEQGSENTKEITTNNSDTKNECSPENTESLSIEPNSNISEPKCFTTDNHSVVNSDPKIDECEGTANYQCTEKHRQNSSPDEKQDDVNDLGILSDDAYSPFADVITPASDKLLQEDPKCDQVTSYDSFSSLPDHIDQRVATENCNNSNSVHLSNHHENKRTEQINGCTNSFSSDEVPPKILKCSEEDGSCPSFIPAAVYVERREEIITENSHEIRTEVLEYMENIECIPIDTGACI